jgi:glycosyltransferase involved in cell wall biosynthesis
MQKRVGIVLVGGLGDGIQGQGLPSIRNITAALGKNFRVGAYTLCPIAPGYRPGRYAFYSPPAWLDGPGRRKLRWPWLAGRILAEHRQEPFDVLLSFWGYPMGTFAVTLAGLLRRPSVVVLLGGETASVPAIGYGGLRTPMTRRLILQTCERASVLVTVSDTQRQVLRQHGLLRSEVRVIPLGVDKQRFRFAPRLPSAGLPLNILHVANLTEVKDQETLVRGFALLRRHLNAKLRVIGPDYLNGRIQQLVATLGISEHVEFLGSRPYSEIPEHYAWAHLFILTSLSEGQNCALTEAAMSGVLQVSTPVGHMRDLGRDMAVIVREGDPADLAAKVREIVTQPSAWQEKVRRARAWAEAHDLTWTVRELGRAVDEASCSK